MKNTRLKTPCKAKNGGRDVRTENSSLERKKLERFESYTSLMKELAGLLEMATKKPGLGFLERDELMSPT